MTVPRMFWLGPLALVLSSSCQGEKPGTAAKAEGVPAMQLTSTAFREGESIPKQYTGDGKNVSLPLRWSDVPDGVKSFALICDDPDAPRGTWVHWVLFNVPAETRELPEGVPAEKVVLNGAKQGINDFSKAGYGGPAPPPGKPHRYF